MLWIRRRKEEQATKLLQLVKINPPFLAIKSDADDRDNNTFGHLIKKRSYSAIEIEIRSQQTLKQKAS